MIKTSRQKIIEIISDNRIGVLHGTEAVELNIHLNAYYLQLSGALDNAAWALHYQFQLLGDINEDDSKARKRCNLFSSGFLRRINEGHSTLATSLESYTLWAKNLKELLRDPVVHRIPLYAVPGVRSPEEEAAASVKWQKVITAMLEPVEGCDDFETAISHIVKSDHIGNYTPIFAMSGSSGYATREIDLQIDSDHKAFLEVMKTVVNALTDMNI